ncbi:MAG: hypothetical protein B0D92_02005 [Spirochaeta sp. LUC14_002_19_P3]|nr:MAG: hypothetical protein B0D92_02005 [Spirochaeta sp. LUC14_002_19_P3]
MLLNVSEVQTKKDIKEFIRLPYGVYRGKGERYDAWVPPLDLDIRHIMDRKNPIYDHTEGKFWLVRENGKTLGRIAAFIDRNFIEFQKTKTGFFGFFECYNHQEAANALFAEAEKWLKAKGMEKTLGPVNGSTNYQLGNQIDSFDEMPVIEMPYSAPFYGKLIEEYGFVKARDLYSYRMNVSENDLSEKFYRVSAIAAERNGIKIRLANMRNWDAEVAIVKEIWEDAWHDNWGFTPWYEPEFKAMAKNLKLVMIPELTYIAEINGEAVGFCFPIPDVNFAFHRINGKLFPTGIFHLLSARKKSKNLRVAAFGVKKRFQNKGVDSIMIAKLRKDGLATNHLYIGEFSWILDTNYPLRNLLEKWGCERYRTHRVYEKNL